jgi:hypothetical protein
MWHQLFISSELHARLSAVLSVPWLVCESLSQTDNYTFQTMDCSYLLTLVPHSRIFLPWRWRRYVPPKRWFTQDLHGATSHKTAFFIVTAVKTSNLTYTFRDYENMNFIIGEAHDNGAAVRLGAYPRRRLPHPRTFHTTDGRIRKTYCSPFCGKPRKRTSVPTVDVGEHTPRCVEEKPRTSNVEARSRICCSHNNLEQLLYPYHLQQMRDLSPLDFHPLQKFCNGSFDNTVKISSLAAAFSQGKPY